MRFKQFQDDLVKKKKKKKMEKISVGDLLKNYHKNICTKVSLHNTVDVHNFYVHRGRWTWNSSEKFASAAQLQLLSEDSITHTDSLHCRQDP